MSKFTVLFYDHPDLVIEADHYNTSVEAAVFRKDAADGTRARDHTVAYVPLRNVLAIVTKSGEVPVP